MNDGDAAQAFELSHAPNTFECDHAVGRIALTNDTSHLDA